MRIARVNTGAAMLGEGKGRRLVRFGVPGTADICGLLSPSGRLLMIEVKAKTGRAGDAQKVMRRVITAFGGLYVIARSLADVDLALAEVGIFR